MHHRRLLYLFPYGSTGTEYIEILNDNHAKSNQVIDEGPLFIFYDQEPIIPEFNYILFDHIKQNFRSPFVLVTTEEDSEPLQKIKEKYGWQTVSYFHHILAAADWYRGYRYDEGITQPSQRTIKKKYITFNRITGNSRVYRSLFVAELQKRNLLWFGHVSYSKNCPVHGDFSKNLLTAVEENKINIDQAKQSITLIESIDNQLRIDSINNEFIKNDSMTLGPLQKLMESFVYVVTETCFWETKKHLTEKIFKPIVAKQPFILLGCANNLEYLKSYGFKTFDAWWDESYDNIQDPIARLQAVVDQIENICKLDNETLQNTLVEMQSVLDHNYNLFYSQDFIDNAWQDLKKQLRLSVGKQ